MELQLDLKIFTTLLKTNLLQNDFQFINTDKLRIDKECFDLKQVFLEELDAFILDNLIEGGLIVDGAFFRLQECQYYAYSFIDLATLYFNNYFCESYNISDDINIKFYCATFIENYNNGAMEYNKVFRVEKKPYILTIQQIQNWQTQK